MTYFCIQCMIGFSNHDASDECTKCHERLHVVPFTAELVRDLTGQVQQGTEPPRALGEIFLWDWTCPNCGKENTQPLDTCETHGYRCECGFVCGPLRKAFIPDSESVARFDNVIGHIAINNAKLPAEFLDRFISGRITCEFFYFQNPDNTGTIILGRFCEDKVN